MVGGSLSRLISTSSILSTASSTPIVRLKGAVVGDEVEPLAAAGVGGGVEANGVGVPSWATWLVAASGTGEGAGCPGGSTLTSRPDCSSSASLRAQGVRGEMCVTVYQHEYSCS